MIYTPESPLPLRHIDPKSVEKTQARARNMASRERPVVHKGGKIERLLRENVLKVTISSPTLAQGLNLSATAVIVHSLHRAGERIDVSEFKNVIGRAGRAFVDVEGIVLFPMFDEVAKKRESWEALIGDLGARNMESGLIQLIAALLTRMSARVGGDINQLTEYIVNNAAAWTFPEVARERPDTREKALANWERHIATLDTAILSLIGENDIPDGGIEAALDDILQSSPWHRRLQRCHSNEASRRIFKQQGPCRAAGSSGINRRRYAVGLLSCRRGTRRRACARRHRGGGEPAAGWPTPPSCKATRTRRSPR